MIIENEKVDASGRVIRWEKLTGQKAKGTSGPPRMTEMYNIWGQ